MRQGILTALHRIDSQGVGRPRSRGLGDAAGCVLTAYGNYSVAATAATCGSAALSASPDFSAAVGAAFKAAAVGAVDGTEVEIGIGLVEWAVNQFSSDAAMELAIIVGTVCDEIMSLIGGSLIASVIGTVAAGLGSFGYIGAVIAFIVSLVEVAVELLDPSHLTITNGNTYSCQDYGKNNLMYAANYLATGNYAPSSGLIPLNTVGKAPSLQGLTALTFADQFDLFLANPIWLWANQNLTGLPQPYPPDYGAGTPIDVAYSRLPGAYELLNQAQFAQAAVFHGVTVSKLAFYMSIPQPTGPAVMVSGMPVDPAMMAFSNPNNWNPAWSQGDMSWAPEQGIAGFADTVLAWPARTVGANTTDPNEPTNTSGSGITYESVSYASCPNIVTNASVYDGSGNIVGQTHIAPGVYMLQIMYPTLTTSQCLTIFAAMTPAYNAWVASATQWAQQQCYVTAAMLGTGSQWNLEDADVAAVLAAVKAAGLPSACNVDEHTAVLLAQGWANSKCPCPTIAEIQALAGLVDPHNPSSGMLITTSDAQAIVQAWKNPSCKTASNTATTTTTNTLLKGTALVGGLSAIGLAWYAARHGVSITKAANMVYGDTKTFAVTTKRKLLRKI